VSASLISSLDDDISRPSPELLDLALASIMVARIIRLDTLIARGAPNTVALWPGEHYRLLAALTRVLQPASTVEVGTLSGLGTLSIASELTAKQRLTTFDIVPIHEVHDAYLRDDDMRDGRIRQIIADVTDPGVSEEYLAVLRGADFLFVDGPKDGRFEPAFLRLCETLPLKPGTVLLFDDVRTWNMLKVWRSVAHPKLDLVSFGHWTGTGLVLW
jgi:predicted O-methyltransferase YrrM